MLSVITGDSKICIEVQHVATIPHLDFICFYQTSEVLVVLLTGIWVCLRGRKNVHPSQTKGDCWEGDNEPGGAVLCVPYP